jgi:hypothetical protein
VSWLVGPIAAGLLILGLALMALGAGSGRGWAVPRIATRALLIYLGSGLCGIILGAAIGLVRALIRRTRPGARLATWCAAANRPIRLFPRRRSPIARVETSPPPPRRHRWPWRVAVAVLVVLATAFGAGVYLGRLVDRRLDDAIATADRDDPFWRLDDLMAHRDPVPDEQNSALVVAEALAKVPENWPAGPKPLPGEPMPEVMRAYDRLDQSAANIRLDDATAEVLRGELDAYEEGVRIARTVADYRRGRHDLELGPTLIDTPLAETQAARTPARLLAADAAIRAHDGDLDGALDSCRAILGVGRSIGDEPFLIAQLVRMAIGEVAMKSARRILGQGEPSDAALGRLQVLVLDELAQPLLLHGMRGERAIQSELIRRVGAGEIPITALGGATFDPEGPRAVMGPCITLWFDYQQAVGLEWLNEAVAIARRPAAERPPLWEQWEANRDRVRRSRLVFTAVLPLLLMPVLPSAGMAHSRYHAELGAASILLAAERHRRKTGAWPASIAAIDPAFLPSRPVDPFTGQPFRMEHREGQLRIYSLGPNHQDEHGAYDPKQWMKQRLDDYGTGAWDVPLRRQLPSPKDQRSP